MFCVNCGSKLADDAVFCSTCGTKVEDVRKVEVKNSKAEDSFDDNHVNFIVKPTFNFLYEFLPLFWLIVFALIIGLCVFMFSVEIGTFFTVTLLAILLIGITVYAIWTKKTYEKVEYCFYNTKVIFKDTFINISEKEIKYKHIREISLRQSFLQRMFGIGNIVLYTNAESGISNGLTLMCIQNVNEVYKKVKEIAKI